MRDQDQRQQETMGAGSTEGAAQEESGLLSAIVEGTTDAVFVKDLEGRYLLVNSACARILGRPKEEIVGRHDAQILPPETAGRLAGVDRLVMATGEASSYEEMLPVAGRPRTYLSTKSVHRDAAGNALGIIGISRDITERKEAERAQRFLAEAGEMLSSSLDYRTTLASVARLAVPDLADWCGVDVLSADGSIDRLAVAHEDPEKVPLALELQERYPADPEASSGLHNVLRSGRPEFYAAVTDAMLGATAKDTEHLRLLREIGFRSVIIVPMVTRGRTLGAVTLVMSESGRGFGEADLALAEELARRAATAVDNAGLYEEARREIAERERAEEAAFEVREAERSRLARDLHDGVLQDLSVVVQQLEVRRFASETEGSDSVLDREIGALRRAVRGLREAVYDLRPSDEASFFQRLGEMVHRYRDLTPEREIALVVEDGFPLELSEGLATQLLRLVREALSNARQHSAARRVRVTLGTNGGELEVEVADDGRGFVAGAEDGGMGLSTMRERAALLGGVLEVRSEPGGGTRVHLRLAKPDTP